MNAQITSKIGATTEEASELAKHMREDGALWINDVAEACGKDSLEVSFDTIMRQVDANMATYPRLLQLAIAYNTALSNAEIEANEAKIDEILAKPELTTRDLYELAKLDASMVIQKYGGGDDHRADTSIIILSETGKNRRAESVKPVCGTCGGDGNCPDCMVWDTPLTEVLATLPKGMDAYDAVEAAILADYPQLAEAAQPDAPVCPTCGGQGFCMDCDTLTIEDAQTDLDGFRAELLKPQSKNRNHILFVQGRISEFEEYIARRQTALNDLNHILDREPAAPIDIVTRLETRAAESAENDDDPMPYKDVLLMFDAADEIRRLQAVITGLQSDLHECERARRATDEAFVGYREAAEAEAEQLRGELFKERGSHTETTKALNDLLAGRPITSIQYDADYEPSPWVWRVRTIQQVSWHNTKTQAQAIKDAQAIADSIVRQLERGY